MPTPGKLEVTIKINQLPLEVITDKNGWKVFELELGNGRGAHLTLRPRMWNRIEQAAQVHPHWVAVITGLMGEDVHKGVFKLLEPNLQVFEYKPREPKANADKAGETDPAQGS